MKQKESLIGRRFHRLVVIAPADPDKNGVKRWLCKCDCGNEKIIYQNALCRGATKSCGCYNKEESRKRMSRGWDKIFTKEFLEAEHIKNKKSLREIAKETGCTVSCVIKYMKKHELETNDPFYNIVGKRFEMLTVISMSHTKNSKSYWNVQCDCGTQKIVAGAELVRCQIVSCGCWNKQKDWKGYGDLSKTYWSKLVGGAKKRNIPFEIDIKYAWELFQQQQGVCPLSGRKIVMDRSLSWSYRKGEHKQTASLDRIDPKRGYCVGNVQWVHVILNRMKSDLEQNDFINWCRDVSCHNATKASDCIL